MIFDIQKASVLKRVSAFVLDLILFAILAVGIAALIGLACDYDGHIEKLENYFTSYKAEYELKYDVDLDISENDYNLLSAEEQQNWQEAYNACNEALNADTGATATFIRIISYTLLMVSLGILFSMAVLEFAFPLLFKNGQTLGKKIFGVAVMRIDGVKVSPLFLLVRTVLGKYTVETMIPVFVLLSLVLGTASIVTLVLLLLLIIAQVALLIFTQARTPLHDMLAGTVTVDFASQLIFDTPEELLEYKKKLHADSVAGKESNL